MHIHSLLVRDKKKDIKNEDFENMTKNKNQKKKAAAAVVAKKNNNNNSPPNGVLTPPGTPPSSNGVGSKPTPGTYLNGMARKPPVPWEREFIGTFLLEMADRQVISARSEWYVDKTKMRQMFEAHLASHSQSSEVRLKLSIQGAWNIGSLLHRTNFLINTPRGNNNYRIKNFALMEFRKEKFNLMDENHRQRDASALSMATGSGGVSLKGNGGAITEEYKLDSEAPAIILKYQKTQEQMPKNFELDSMGCYVCQVNFETIEKYEEHVEYHGDESDFSSLKKMKKLSSPKLTLSYQTCVDSHYFGFTLKTKFKGLVVHKFIIVQSRQFFYVNNARMPLEVSESGELIFFVDSHVFMILREMPIVIGFTCNGTRYVEQHHFMRTEALPKASFNINPYRLSSNETFKSQRLDPANPPTEVLHALKHEDAQVRLADFDKQYRDFCERGRDLTQQNISGTLRTLLQVEDIERLQHYLSLKQSKMELHQFGRELSVKLQQSANSMGVEDIVSPGDDVLIINERGSPEGGVRQLLESNNQVLELALKDFDAIVQWGRTVDERFGSLDKSCRVFFARILGVSTQRVNITCERQLADNTTYTLIFRPLRAVMRYQYRALQQLALTRAEDVQRILFPSDIPRESVPLGGALKLNNGRIASNPEQLDAVKQIALCKKLPAPYIVFGPPGTGKTATICEAIYQLYVNRPETNILVVAGSNTACDEVALRLLQAIAKAPESQPRPLARIFAASCDRRIDNIDDLLLEYSNMYSVHFYPAVQALHQYRIVVCTLSLAGKLSTGGFARGDIFSHVFLDEAAASTEAEALMAITCTMSPSSNLILSGDHKQLGPVLQSQRATEWGLDVSLFERLLERKCYKVGEDGSYNKAIQTRLIRNFRSHPEIVSLYSELYYDGKLKAQAPMDAVCRFKTWFHTPNADFPIMFHSVFGTVMNTKSSVSLCNNKEIDAVMDYVKDLMYFGLDGEKVSQSDIGVISPYKSQYLRIQEQLNMRNWSQIDCGSVELFQGKEKQVIIVSFVRSFTPKLGFLNSQRRLNVLLSRPMSLLILIGNPRTLSQNNDFRRIIEMCRDRKTLVGMPYFREEVNCQNKQNATPGGAGRTGAACAAGAVGAAVMHPKPAAATTPGLGQTLKRTTSNAKNPAEAVKLFYNKEELLQLGTQSKAVHKTELDKIFDELPQVPGQRSRYVNHNCDATRAVTAQLKDLKLEVQGQAKGSTSTASSKHPKPLNLPVNTPFRLPSDENTSNYMRPIPPFKGEKKPTASKPMSIPGPSTFRGEQRYINGVPCGIEVLNYQPSAPQMSPPKTTYSYIPGENHRFENMRPMSDEYRRPPPFYEPHRWAHVERPPTPPPATEKKSKCVIS